MERAVGEIISVVDVRLWSTLSGFFANSGQTINLRSRDTNLSATAGCQPSGFLANMAIFEVIAVYLKLNPDNIRPIPEQGPDVTNIGHFRTGEFELTLKSFKDFEKTKHLTSEAFKNIGDTVVERFL